MIPGAARNKIVPTVLSPPSKKWVRKIDGQFSKERLTMPRVMPIEGANQKMVDAGLSNPIFLLLSRTCVRLHRRPPRALALMTRIRPSKTKWASVATISTTPAKIRVITAIKRQEKVSRRNRNANSRTNIKDDDLHMAGQDWMSYLTLIRALYMTGDTHYRMIK